jgi:hypothetical protein
MVMARSVGRMGALTEEFLKRVALSEGSTHLHLAILTKGHLTKRGR